MDAEGTFDGCFQDVTINPSPELEPPSQKPPSPSSTPENGYFDCNICLDFASDPVVTICGHLYCWPCIFRWLHLDAGPRHCPVCKFSLSESSLVPLYGRGLDAKPQDRISDIPKRPRGHRNSVSGHRLSPQPRQGLQMYQNYHFYDNGRVNHMGVLHSTAGAVLGEMVLSMLPWAFRNQELYTSLNQSSVASGRGQRWRQELRAEFWLHQLWLFLFCCAFLCLVFF